MWAANINTVFCYFLLFRPKKEKQKGKKRKRKKKKEEEREREREGEREGERESEREKERKKDKKKEKERATASSYILLRDTLIKCLLFPNVLLLFCLILPSKFNAFICCLRF